MELVLTREQMNLLEKVWGPVPVRDPEGKILGRFEPKLSAQMIAELKRRAASAGPWYSGEQVQNRLRALQEEWDRTGGFDETHLKEFLARLNTEDPGHMRPKGHAE